MSALSVVEWAKIPTVAPYTWEVYRDGWLVRAEIMPGSDELEKTDVIGDPPFTLAAVPQRANMPRLEVDFEPGMRVIWFHVTKMLYDLQVAGKTEAPKDPIRFEYLVIGRRYPNGLEEVWTIFPDGQVEKFDSVEKAIS